MSHSYAEDEDVHHLNQGPQGRTPDYTPRKLFTIVGLMPIESDGRRRYRIKEKGSNLLRIAYENELERPASAKRL